MSDFPPYISERDTTLYSMCDNCNHVPMCGIQADLSQGRIQSIQSWKQGPGGPLCAKAYGLIQQHYHPDRLLTPLRRKSPKGSSQPEFESISWDEAYTYMATKLLDLKKKHGPHSVFFYTGAPKEPRPAVERLATLFGSVNYGTESSTACMRSAYFANHLCFGFNGTQKYPQKNTELSVLWGVNTAVSHPFAMHQLIQAKDAGCRFILIDPKQSTTQVLLRDSALHLRPRLGTTGALAHCLANFVMQQPGFDRQFCQENIQGFEEYATLVADFNLEKGAQITGIAKETLVEAGKLLAAQAAKGQGLTFLASSQSTTHERNGVQNHRGICMLAAVSKAVPPPKIPALAASHALKDFHIWADGGPEDFCLRAERMAWNEHRIDRAHFPAWADFCWEVNTSMLPEEIEKGNIRGLVSFGLNSLIWASPEVYGQAIAKLDFSVAVDYFYRPATHADMDILLPAAMNFERRAPFVPVGKSLVGRTALTPRGEAREDWQIALELGCALGHREKCFDGDPEKACDHILSRWGLTMKDLRKALHGENGNDGQGVPLPPSAFWEFDPPQAPQKPHYPTPSGKIEAWSGLLARHGLEPLPRFEPPYAVDEVYPLQLLSGARRPHLAHSRTRQDCPWLLELDPLPLVEMHPQDAKNRHISQGDRVQLASAWGSLEAWADVRQDTPQGMVAMMHGWANADVNALIPRHFDPLGGYPPFKEVPVQLRKIENSENGAISCQQGDKSCQ